MSESSGSIVVPSVLLPGTGAASVSSTLASGLAQPSDASRVGLTILTPRIRATVLIMCRRDMRPSSYPSTISSARYRLSLWVSSTIVPCLLIEWFVAKPMLSSKTKGLLMGERPRTSPRLLLRGSGLAALQGGGREDSVLENRRLSWSSSHAACLPSMRKRRSKSPDSAALPAHRVEHLTSERRYCWC